MKKFGKVLLVIGLTVLIVCITNIIVNSISNKVFGEKEIKNGISVTGELVSIQQTGNYDNRQPQCELTVQFTTQDGQQVTATDRKVIQLTELAQYQPGTELSIRYDPKNPQNIVIDSQAP